MTKTPLLALGAVVLCAGLLVIRHELRADGEPPRQAAPSRGNVAVAAAPALPVAAREPPAPVRPRITPPAAAPPPASHLVDYVEGSELTAPQDVAAPPPGAPRNPSGLASLAIRAGNGGDHPAPGTRVVVHYVGWQTDGTMIDASVKRGEPATFPVDAVIPGFSEGLQMMTIGEVRRFWIPETLAYKGRAPAGMLVFDIELLDIEAPAPSVSAPAG